jgi:hypothetical protein
VDLKALGGDVRITMYRQKARIICKSRDGGVFRRGQVSGEKEVEQGAKNTALGDARSHFVAVGAHVFIPDLQVAFSEVRGTSSEADSMGPGGRPSIYTVGQCATLCRTSGRRQGRPPCTVCGPQGFS